MSNTATPETEAQGPVTLGSDTIAALESAWADIHDRHPDVIPNVVFIMGTGRKGNRGGLTLGHVTLSPNWSSYRPADSDPEAEVERYHEVFIAAETLAQHPVRLLQTLIHEAAHTVAITRGVKDVSRQNRYHNKRFRAICEEMGLAWQHLDYRPPSYETGNPVFADHPDYDPELPSSPRSNPKYLTTEAKADDVIGYSDMEITEETAEAYVDTLTSLDTHVSVQGAPVKLSASAPKRRRTVCMYAWHAVTEDIGSFEALVDTLGEVPDDGEIQRIGVQVYEGLKARDLLADHLYWIEEV